MQLRTWFLRDLMDVVEREHAGGARARLQERLPERLGGHLEEARLHDAAPTDTIPLDDAEELLLAVDAALGDGSGRVLEDAALGLVSRILMQGGGVVVAGDLLATMQRMRAPLERPFVKVQLLFELTATDTGFSLTLGIPGRPRSARMLRHLGVGAIRAAHRFSHEASDGDFKLYAEVTGDRANISARYRQPATGPSSERKGMMPNHRPSRTMKAVTQRNLVAEVERILGHGQSAPPADDSPRRRPSTIPPPRTSFVGETPSSVPPAHSPSGVRTRNDGATAKPDDDTAPPSSRRGLGG